MEHTVLHGMNVCFWKAEKLLENFVFVPSAEFDVTATSTKLKRCSFLSVHYRLGTEVGVYVPVVEAFMCEKAEASRGR